MSDSRTPPAPSLTQPDFHIGFVWASIAAAAFGGFALGISIAFPVGFQLNLPDDIEVLIRAHGHLQLVGWAGLFIIGVSLYFLPRFLKVPIPFPRFPSLILLLTAGGLCITSAAEILLGSGNRLIRSLPLLDIMRAGSTAEWAGIMAYVGLLVTMMRRHPSGNPNTRQLKPFFGMMTAGWAVCETLMLLQSWLFDPRESMPWNPLIIEAFRFLVLLPAAIAFSVRTFPLFMQIPPIRFPVHRLGAAYLVCTLGALLPALPLPETAGGAALMTFGAASQILRCGLIIWMVVELRIFQKSIMPAERFLRRYFGPAYVEERRGNVQFMTSRKGFYDHGQYGRFELLLTSAYVWLAVSVALDAAESIASLLGETLPVSADASRHAFLLGFVTLLIFGMGQRMLPGFMKRQGVASPRLVFWTFVAGMAAALLRIVPLLLPPSATNGVSGVESALWEGFGISGMIAIAGIALFFANILMTSRAASLPPQR